MVYKCKMCGGDLVLTEGSFVAECEYCGSLQTVPNADNEKKLNLFSRANRLRSNCEFDKAFGVYESIITDYPEEAEAYWGLVLCKYGIEYVDDPITKRKVPTCHRSSFQCVMDDQNLELTLENADPIARKIYREEAKQIEEIRKGIVQVSSQEDPYDIFICYKETGADGQRTIDSVMAQDIYDALTEKKYRVFFSRITLENKLGQEYEPYIFAALNSAKVMLVIGTDYEHFNAVWVRNEWSRYLKLMELDKSKHLIPCFKNVDAYDMPKEFNKLQAQDLGKIGAIQDLLRGIEKLIVPATAAVAKEASLDVTAQLAKGNEALQAKDWVLAKTYFDRALIADVECEDAHLGNLLAYSKVQQLSELSKKKGWYNSTFYKEALNYASDSNTQALKRYAVEAKRRRIRNTCVTGIITAICTTAILLSGWLYLDNLYRGIVMDLFTAADTAANCNKRLEQISFLRKPDENVCIMLSIRSNGSLYPSYRQQGDLVIPDGVTTIGSEAFLNCERLTSVVIPDSVTTIGASAFEGCTKLTSVTIPDSVTSIGNSAFSGCSKLSQIKIGKRVTSIGSAAFLACNALTEITIPDSVVTISNRAFYHCTGLNSVTLPDSVITVDDYAFGNCTHLTSVTLPKGLTEINESIFNGCSALASITIPNSVQKIGPSAFYGCKNLTAIAIPDSVTTIDDYAFSHCTALADITIPDGVTTIGTYAFRSCLSMTSAVISESVEEMASRVFANCENLTYIYCKAAEMPDQWSDTWNEATNAGIVWGYNG